MTQLIPLQRLIDKEDEERRLAVERAERDMKRIKRRAREANERSDRAIEELRRAGYLQDEQDRVSVALPAPAVLVAEETTRSSHVIRGAFDRF